MSDIKLPEPFDTICVLHENGDLEDVPVYTTKQAEAYAEALAKQEELKITAKFETRNDGVIGSTDAPIKRIERQDDTSYTVIIDYWPSPE